MTRGRIRALEKAAAKKGVSTVGCVFRVVDTGRLLLDGEDVTEKGEDYFRQRPDEYGFIDIYDGEQDI